MDTDILFGPESGMTTGFVLSGISSKEMLTQFACRLSVIPGTIRIRHLFHRYMSARASFPAFLMLAGISWTVPEIS